jgi:murein DD-endopeptidase MepM/ murein hydrolase activator NlpD
MGRRATTFLVAAIALALFAAPPAQARSANTAALQVALRAVHVYGGGIDGIAGPRTRGAVRKFQRRRRLSADGVAGARTRRALGRRGRPRLGSRVMRTGRRGWDVAALQFLLRRRGANPGSVDGGFGAGTAAAVRRFQRRAGLGADGVVGPATLRALRRGVVRRRRMVRRVGAVGGAVLFFRPVHGPLGDGFAVRWGRPHQGIDFPVATGTRVGAAGRGVTRFAGWNSGGYGNLVIVQHRLGYQTWYAHLSRVTTWPGEVVTGGTRIGLVGSTGHSTGPHLHFEVRLNGTPINPMPRLLSGVGVARAFPATRASEQKHPGCDPEGLRKLPPTGGTAADPC